jgi:hypothetical protein
MFNQTAFPERKPDSVTFAVIVLIACSTLIYLPMIGKGFIHDDFVHVYHAGYSSFWNGLLQPSSGAFFTPLTNLSYQIDWWLWGGNHPFPLATENLILHISNILLLFALALRLWHSRYAAWWAAFGFSLLFPSNTWALMWIATRAHLLVAFFYLIALHLVLRYAKSDRHKTAWVLAIAGSVICVILAKESGATILIAIPIMLIYGKKARLKKRIGGEDYVLIGILLALAAGYAVARSASGAIGLTFNTGNWYSYTVDWKVLLENFLRYGWRTFGLLALIAIGIYLERRLQHLTPRLSFVSKSDIFMSLALFFAAVAPFLLMRARSGIYTYLPGLCAALLLGSVAYSFSESVQEKPSQRRFAAHAPILLVSIVYIAFSFGYSLKWLSMAKTNTSIISQIHALQPAIQAHSVIVLQYTEDDRVHRFPEGLSWGFPFAVRLRYKDPTLDGLLVRKGTPTSSEISGPSICFEYQPNTRSVQIKRTICY